MGIEQTAQPEDLAQTLFGFEVKFQAIYLFNTAC
jgi:hypothetical protein